MQELEQSRTPQRPAKQPVIIPPAALEPNLVATTATKMPKALGRTQQQGSASLEFDGIEPLAKFIIQHRLASHEIVNAAVTKVRRYNTNLSGVQPQGLAASVLEEICNAGIDMETLIGGIIDRTKFAYVPLDYYEVDRQVVKLLPEYLTLGRLIVPFDIVSRTMMVAVDNPFDAGAKTCVQQMVDYHIQWHLAMPTVIRKTLRDVYRITD